MKNRDLFALETALVTGCASKHWPLVKAWDRMLAEVRRHTEPMRARLVPSAAVREYQRAVNRVTTNGARERTDVLNEKIHNLETEHANAVAELAESRQLELDMLDDETEIVLAALDEKLFHDAGVLRVEPSAFFTLSRLGLIKE